MRFSNKQGVLKCVDLASGDTQWQHRLGGATWASPIVSGEAVYYFLKDGMTVVVSHDGGTPEILAEKLRDPCSGRGGHLGRVRDP